MVNNGFPLWFRCFSGIKDPEAFDIELIKEGILYVHNLFKGKNCTLNFLADRWFNFCGIMDYINSLGDIYYIRTKSNIFIDVSESDYSEHVDYISDITPLLTKSKYFDSVYITKNRFHTKLTVSKLDSHKEALCILTNGDTRNAVKIYGYRFRKYRVFIQKS